MVKRMLIDCTHSEETRVVVMNGTRLEDFDVETSTKQQIKGNVYLAKVIRVEPSLQAAFVDYGGNRHGFLAFSEIHPDYYQIPVADRERLMAEVAEDEHLAETNNHHTSETEVVAHSDEPKDTDVTTTDATPAQAEANTQVADVVSEVPAETAETATTDEIQPSSAHTEASTPVEAAPESKDSSAEDTDAEVEQLGGEDQVEQTPSRRLKPHRQYKIQEVIKRKQILLVQVVKEERGNKGAALTTFLSLAGRYCVLMPNTPRGGGVSRKITSITDRRRLKDMMSGLEIPQGMAVIVRTAGSERSKTEIKRDYEYLLRTWSSMRSLTMQSRAPATVYEEATLIKRSIRDVYSRDIDEILVEGEDGYRVAKDFMKALTPSHAKKVQPYRDSNHMPLFHRYQVETQLEALHNTEVTLKSGGYIVLNQTEALVAIDVNSGRSTRERNIEETAVKTNLEAADEIARQLRLRDLAGLVVVDYIDMEDAKNNAAVERRTKDALRSDRARIQVGRISAFGLMELSRQRLRPSFMENSYITCPHCKGEGVIRSTESEVIRILRVIEEEGVRRRSAEITVSVPTNIALYILNQKRSALADIEARYGFAVTVNGSDTMGLGELTLDRVRSLTKAESDALVLPPPITVTFEDPEDDTPEASEDTETEAATAPVAAKTDDDDDDDGKKKRRRRKRRGKRSDQDGETESLDLELNENGTVTVVDDDDTYIDSANLPPSLTEEENGPKKSRRRGRRGGRRRNRAQHVTDQTVEHINVILAEAVDTEKDPVVIAMPEPKVTAAPAPTPEAPQIEAPAPHTETAAPAAAVAETPVETEEKPAKPRRTRKPAAPKVKVAAAEGTPEDVPAKPKRTRKPAAPKAAAPKAEVPANVETKSEATIIPIIAIDTPKPDSVRHSLIDVAPKTAAPMVKMAAIVGPSTPIKTPEAPEASAQPEPAPAQEKLAEPAAPTKPAEPARKGWWSR